MLKDKELEQCDHSWVVVWADIFRGRHSTVEICVNCGLEKHTVKDNPESGGSLLIKSGSKASVGWATEIPKELREVEE